MTGACTASWQRALIASPSESAIAGAMRRPTARRKRRMMPTSVGSTKRRTFSGLCYRSNWWRTNRVGTNRRTMSWCIREPPARDRFRSFPVRSAPLRRTGRPGSTYLAEPGTKQSPDCVPGSATKAICRRKSEAPRQRDLSVRTATGHEVRHRLTRSAAGRVPPQILAAPAPDRRPPCDRLESIRHEAVRAAARTPGPPEGVQLRKCSTRD